MKGPYSETCKTLMKEIEGDTKKKETYPVLLNWKN